MKKFVIFLIALFIGLGIFFWVTKTIGLEGIKNAFLTLAGPKGIVIFGLTVLMLLVGAWKWKTVLKSQGFKISLKELWTSFWAASSIFFFTPILILAGDIFRTYILKERKNIVWEKAMASVIIDRILEWTFNILIILAGAIFFITKISPIPLKLEIILIGSLIILIGVAVFFYFKSFRKESIVSLFLGRISRNHFLDIEKEVFKFFKPKNKEMWKCFGINFLRGVTAILRCWLVLVFLGKGLAILPAISILGFYFLALLIPIPAALGSHDALQAFSFGALGLGADAGAAFAMIIRGAELIAALVGLIFLFRLGAGLIKNIIFRKIDSLINSVVGSKSEK